MLTDLVEDVEHGDVLVDGDGALVVEQQVEDVGHGGGHPAAALVEELAEALGAVRVGVAGRRVLDAEAALQHQRAQPTVLAFPPNQWPKQNTIAFR